MVRFFNLQFKQAFDNPKCFVSIPFDYGIDTESSEHILDCVTSIFLLSPLGTSVPRSVAFLGPMGWLPNACAMLLLSVRKYGFDSVRVLVVKMWLLIGL